MVLTKKDLPDGETVSSGAGTVNRLVVESVNSLEPETAQILSPWCRSVP